jgi:predicted nuclease of predicted toxin-antitoxin system
MKIDFGALLAMTHANSPSVIQIRTQDVLPEAIAELLLRVLTDHGAALQDGAIVSVDQRLSRVRVLPVIP